MVDRELEVTGVAAEGFDQEERVTGVPAGNTDGPGIAPPPVTDQGVEAFSESARTRAALLMRQTAGPQIGAPTENMLVGEDRDIAAMMLRRYDPSLDNEDAMNEALKMLDTIWSPEVRDALWSEEKGRISEALAQTDKEYVASQMIAMNLAQNDPESTAGLVGAAIQSAVTQWENRLYRLHRPGAVLFDQDVASNQFEAAQLPIDDIAKLVDLGDDWRIDDTGVGEGNALADLLASDEFKSAVARDGIWKIEDDTLVFAVQDDDGVQLAGVHLDEGTKITNTVEAVAALVDAKLGNRHRLVADEIAGTRTVQGAVTKAFGDIIRGWEKRTTRGWENALVPGAGEWEAEVSQDDVELAREAARDKVASGGLTQDLAVALRTNPDYLLLSPEGQYAMAEELAADPAVQQQFIDLSTEERVEAARQQREDDGSWVEWANENVLPPVVELLETYDKMIHFVGITVSAAVRGVFYELDSDDQTTFQTAFDQAKESTYVSEFYGVDPQSAWGQTLNTGVSMMLDPVMWVTPGGRASWAWMKEMVTNPAMAPKLLATPQWRSAVRNLVNGNNPAVAVSFGWQGMDDKAVRSLLRTAARDIPIAERPQVAKEVSEIMRSQLPSAGGNWIPASPRAMVHAKNVLGVGATIQDISTRLSRGSMPREKLQQWAEVWYRASNDNGFALGDNVFNQALDLATWRHGDDIDSIIEWMDSLAGVMDEAEAAAPELLTAKAVELQQAKNQLRAARRRIKYDPDLNQMYGYRQLQRELQRIVTAADETGSRASLGEIRGLGSKAKAVLNDPAVSYDGFDEALRRVNAYVDAYGTDYDEAVEAVAEARSNMRRLAAEKEALETVGDRSGIVTWLNDFMEDWADELNIPKVYDHEGNLKPNWTEVTNKPPTIPTGDPNTSVFSGYVGASTVDDLGKVTTESTAEMLTAARFAETLRQFGVGPEQSVHILPASPIEMLGYKHGSKAYRAAMRDARVLTADRVSGSLDAIQNVFAAAALLRPITAFKAASDELIRFVQETGFSRRSIGGSVASLPGVERAGLWRHGLSERALGYGRDLGSPSARRQRPWRVVSAKKHPEAAQRFVNGSMVRDPVVAKYAEARRTGVMDEWAKWWNEEGIKTYKRLGGEPMTAQEAYGMMDEVMNYFFTRGGKPLSEDRIINPILDAARSGTQVDLPLSAWRQFPDVPGQVHKNSGPFDWAFEQLFGRPSNARGAVIFDHYYQFHLGLGREAAGSRIIRNMYGRSSGLAEPERLVHIGVADDLSEARNMLRQGRRHPKVKALLADGWKLETDLDQAAAGYAKSAADSMMYQMATTSVAGNRASRIFPWARAQTDYMNWWYKKLREPSQFQLQVGTRGVGPTATVNTGVNIRLADRMAHLFTINPDPDAESPAGSPQDIVETFSFLPSSLDDDFIIQNLPSMGPLPSWFVNFAPDDHPLRRIVETLVPSHGIFNEYDNDSVLGSLGNAFNAVVPGNPGSPRAVITALAKAGVFGSTKLTGQDINQIHNLIYSINTPPFYRESYGMELADWVNRNVFDPKYPLGGALTPEIFNELQANAMTRALNRDAAENTKKAVGLPNYYGAEAQYAAEYGPLVQYVGDLLSNEHISQRQADNLRIAWMRVDDGLQGRKAIGSKDDLEARKDFTNIARNIMMNLPPEVRDPLLLDHPGMAINMVSWVLADEDLVPDEYRDVIVGGRVRTNDSDLRNEIYTRGRREGWIYDRNPDDVARDVVRWTYKAASSEVRNLWDDLVPSDIGYNTRDDFKLAYPLTADAATVEPIRAMLTKIQVDVPETWEQPDGSWEFTAGELRDLISGARTRFGTDWTQTVEFDGVLSVANDKDLLTDTREAIKIFNEMGYNNPTDAKSGPEWEEAVARWEWDNEQELNLPGDGTPETYRELLRQRHRDEITLNDQYTTGMWVAELEDEFGPLEYEPFQPPPIKDLEVTFSAPSRYWEVVDGDTLELLDPAGEYTPFRLVGINAPDKGEPGYVEWTQALMDIVKDADEVTVGMFDRAKYGDVQVSWSWGEDQDGNPRVPLLDPWTGDPLVSAYQHVERRERILGVLYVDGVPLYDPTVFSEANLRGLPSGRYEKEPPYRGWLIREQGGV